MFSPYRTKILFLLVLFSASLLVAGQLEREKVQDLKEHWLIYKGGQFEPYISTEAKESHTLSFFIPGQDMQKKFLHIEFHGEGAVFVNNRLLVSQDEKIDGVWSLDSLSELLRSEQMLVTVYFKNVNSEDVVTEVVKFRLATLLTTGFLNVLMTKKISTSNQFFVLLFIFFCVYMAFVRRHFWYDFIEMFNPLNIISDKPDDQGSKGKFFTVGNLFLLAVIPFVSALVWLYTTQHDSKHVFDYHLVHDFEGIGAVQIFFFVYLILILKYLWVSGLSRLFSLSGSHAGQYFRGIRLIVFMSVFVTVGFFLYTYFGGKPIASKALASCLIFLVIFKASFLGVKLIASSSFKKLHLFSYLCATEIIPQFLMVNFFLG